MRKLLLFTSILLLFTVTAFAQFITGNTLLASLKKYESLNRGVNLDDKDFLDLGKAWGYVTGVFDQLLDITIDPPEGITAGQVADIVQKYLEEHPESRHERGSWLVTRALIEVWPKKDEPYKKRGSKDGIKLR